MYNTTDGTYKCKHPTPCLPLTDVRLRSLDFLPEPHSSDGSGFLVPMRYTIAGSTLFNLVERCHELTGQTFYLPVEALIFSSQLPGLDSWTVLWTDILTEFWTDVELQNNQLSKLEQSFCCFVCILIDNKQSEGVYCILGLGLAPDSYMTPVSMMFEEPLVPLPFLPYTHSACIFWKPAQPHKPPVSTFGIGLIFSKVMTSVQGQNCLFESCPDIQCQFVDLYQWPSNYEQSASLLSV